MHVRFDETRQNHPTLQIDASRRGAGGGNDVRLAANREDPVAADRQCSML